MLVPIALFLHLAIATKRRVGLIGRAAAERGTAKEREITKRSYWSPVSSPAAVKRRIRSGITAMLPALSGVEMRQQAQLWRDFAPDA